MEVKRKRGNGKATGEVFEISIRSNKKYTG